METVTNKTLEKLKYDLVRDGLVSYEDIEKANELAISQNINIGQVLIKSNLITEEKLLKFLESKLHYPYVDLKDYTLDIRCLPLITLNDAQTYKIIPLFKIENVLTVAMADPLDLFAIDKIVEKTLCDIEPVISSENSILKAIEEYYKSDSSVGQINIDENQNQFDWQEELHNDVLSEEHIQILIRAILKQAILNNIHELFFENTPKGLSVNFRRGADIINTGQIPPVLVVPFISKLKTLSSLDANICELPQLGKLIFKVDDIVLIASISAYPTINGERISLKIYKPPKTLQEIGFTETQINTVKSAMETPGVVIVCGASSSGKTHIIYSVLSEIAKTDTNKNIMTIESIAKYNLENINQCELNENIGFNIDKAMRFIEFQSPDIIYFEGIMSKTALDYFGSLVFKNKVLITEFLADNMADLNKKLSYFEMFKPLISCIIFVHNQDRIEVIDKNDIRKFIGVN